ncbi:hypothetical protein F2K62_000205 [Vibrio fluvialis]|nr:hypothetical protein [Vibrio fluvialis]
MSELKAYYDKHYLTWDILKEEASVCIRSMLESEEIKYHSIQSRIKTLDSLLSKIEKKEVTLDNINEITDIIGLRIICLFRVDIDNILKKINSVFDIEKIDNKLQDYNDDTFGYQSVHVIARIRDDFKGVRYDNIKNICFEVQVRTVAMDAWANISHYLSYKSKLDIPREMRRDFYALSALFHLADSNFEMLYDIKLKNKSHIQEHSIEEVIDETPIDLDVLTGYLSKKFVGYEMPNNDSYFSTLLSELYEAGYSNLEQLDVAIDKGMNVFEEYQLEYPPQSEKGRKYNVIGVIRSILSIVDENYYSMREKSGKSGFPERFEKYRKRLKVL